MKDMYFVIRNSDGDTTVRTKTKEELLQDINDGEYGNSNNILTEIPEHTDTNYWGEGVLIIKGHMVVPKAIKVVTEFTIE